MKKNFWPLIASLVMLALIVTACAPAATSTQAPAAQPTQASAAQPSEAAAQPTQASASGKTQISMWSHSAGNPTEIAVVKQIIADFNASQDQYEIALEAFPQASYNDSVAAASVAGSLPCVLDLDAPTVPNFAWSGYIQPLPITDAELAKMNILDADVGRFQGKVYSLGQFDVALLIYGRKSILDKYNIRIPTLDQPWTKDEFMAALDTLKNSGEFEYPIDLNASGTGEWVPYAYSPMLQSFGGDLVDRSTYLTAEGVLNGPEAVAWGDWFQGMFKDKYANPTPADDQGFLQGRIPLWYTGSWSANDVVKAYGDDALFLPTVDFGKGPKIGAGSWQWGISNSCPNADGAWQFVSFLMQPKQVAAMSNVTGLVPTTSDAAALTDTYKPGGPYQVFYDMAKKYAVIRPPTPGYLIISSAFEQAALGIRDGGDVQNALDDAVDKINQDITDHNNYGFK
jgi:multiple sugar transport system substrate-binding protein